MRIFLGRMRALRLAGAVALAAGVVTACTTGDVMTLRPQVDVGTRTAAVVDAVPVDLPADLPVETPAVVPVTMPEPDLQPADPDPSMGVYPSSDVVTDEQPETMPPQADAGVQAAPAPQTVATQMPAPDLQATVPPEPLTVAYPRFEVPVEEPAAMPADEVKCRRFLKRLGVTFRDVAPIRDGPACGIDWPVKVSAIGSVKMKPAATLSCSMAATFSLWTKKELVPAARWRYLSGVKAIHQGSSYSCRNIRGSRGTPSQHAIGNALDVMRIELKNGKDIDVRKPGWFAFRQRAFLNTVRRDGCDYFSTVLGPGYNADHADHFHFDVKPRRNGYVACR